MEKRQTLAEKRDTLFGGLALYWKEALITALIIVFVVISAPRLQPATSHVEAQVAEAPPRELRSSDTWPFSLHVKRLPE